MASCYGISPLHLDKSSLFLTRNSQDLLIPKHVYEFYKRSFHRSAIEDWNNLPIDIRELP